MYGIYMVVTVHHGFSAQNSRLCNVMVWVA